MNQRPIVAALACAALLAGCATAPGKVNDPFEASNRAMFAINEPLVEYFVKPVAQAYTDIVPDFMRTAVTNYVNNIDDLFSIVNDALQGKWEKMGNDMARVMINTGFGLAGLIDIASDAGIPRGMEDFGQTFGYWGIPQGPFLFIPLWGPTTVRDGTGSILRLVWSPTNEIPSVPARNVMYGFVTVNEAPGAVEALKLVDQAALDRYNFVRRAYLQRREYLVHDGNPPRAKDDDE
ncbi:MAG: VacJ family lipoprotein [Burkholderiales bacterium]|nr:VacJ family lipoprotein [Burkholderiales bacterium]